jgi:hypothetical protein
MYTEVYMGVEELCFRGTLLHHHVASNSDGPH